MYDSAVIGMGIIGACTARELARYTGNIICLEAANDAACGSTKANSGIVHAGYDAKPGSRKAYFNVLGNAKYDDWARELEFPFVRNGSLVLCHGPEELPTLRELYERGQANGVANMELLDAAAVYALEPNLTAGVAGALWLRSSGITSPYEFCIAAMENARANGAEVRFSTKVVNIWRESGYFAMETDAGVIEARTVVNAAGLYSDAVHNMVCGHKLNIAPRLGEYMLMDNNCGACFTRTLFNLPTKMGKGILISPTVDGNLLLGPTAEEAESRENVATTAAGMAKIASQCLKNWDFPASRFITEFAGLRAHLEGEDDFVVGEAPDVPGFFDACGIESPGLTAAPAIAEFLSVAVAKKLGLCPRPDFQPCRPAIRRFGKMSESERQAAVAENPQYGHMICRCEKVTEAEVVEAVRRGAHTLDGIKKRTRAGMGLCQRGFCGPELTEILARELGIPMEEILQDQAGSEIFTGRIR